MQMEVWVLQSQQQPWQNSRCEATSASNHQGVRLPIWGPGAGAWLVAGALQKCSVFLKVCAKVHDSVKQESHLATPKVAKRTCAAPLTCRDIQLLWCGAWPVFRGNDWVDAWL
jgi:hypothetical protein